MQCTSCMCEWDADEGFYRTADGAIAQPCKVCRCDSSSVYYWNNAEAVREAKRTVLSHLPPSQTPRTCHRLMFIL
jgi:hypothetical protein